MKANIAESLFLIDTDSVIPLYHQIKENLSELIEGGLLPEGQLIPSERELAEVYGVNRLTVRQAVSQLAKEGVLRRERGVGTFVCASATSQRLSDALGFSAITRGMGLEPSSRVVSLEVVPAPVAVAQWLELAPDSSVYKLVRIRCADGTPTALETAFLPEAFFPDLASIDFTDKSLYSVLAEEYGCRVMEAEDRLRPVILSSYEQEMLEADKTDERGIPMLGILLESVGYDQRARAVNYSKSVVKGGRSSFCLHIKRHIPAARSA